MPHKGKKKSDNALGRAIIRAKNTQKRDARAKLRGGPDVLAFDPEAAAARPLQSIIEVNSLDDFLATAAMEGRTFEATRERIVIMEPGLVQAGVAPAGERSRADEFRTLQIPRRPEWDASTTPAELDERERKSFLEWRRGIARLEEGTRTMQATPFEKNLNVWRQLWRVIERSDVVVQIVDARNPLVFRCPDIESYVKDVDARKHNVLLVNKADFLSEELRLAWAQHFMQEGTDFVFFSARLEQERLDADAKRLAVAEGLATDAELVAAAGATGATEGDGADSDADDGFSREVREGSGAERADAASQRGDDAERVGSGSDASSAGASSDDSDTDEHGSEAGSSDDDGSVARVARVEAANAADARKRLVAALDGATIMSRAIQRASASACAAAPAGVDMAEVRRRARVLNREEMLAHLEGYCRLVQAQRKEAQADADSTGAASVVIGTVGFPNVGKSSLINVLLGVVSKSHGLRVAVGATPGKTKHFQTMVLSDRITLCDCPGLVFPTLMRTKAEMVVNGVLPLDQLREHIPPVQLVCERIPRLELEEVYGLRLPLRLEDGAGAYLRARDMLQAYSTMRGFMASGHAGPDEPRGARCVLRDYVTGRLLVHCHPPPGMRDAIEELRQQELAVAQRMLVEHETALLEERAEREAALLANPLAPNVAKRVAKEDRKRKIRGKTKKGRRERDPYGCTVEPGEPLPDTAVPLARTAGRHGQADFRRATFPYQAGARK